ncbi:MAG: ZIP family metal transporter [Bacteroidia bacterium]|nr:ZIP family metal transporter [Bacteroidia bacterium]NNC86639.1 ZIP family metal transporter [Bacteroidia bacterium]NNM16232.1 ZIP family metal transporter [Bacteroidia bacterium]
MELIFQILVLFLSVILGGSLYFIFKPEKKAWLLLSLAFSGAFLFALCVLELIPSLYKLDFENTGLYILLGFFLQIVLDYFSQGIEHGHIHVQKNHSTWFPLLLMSGLCVHAFLEGMPLAFDYSSEAGGDAHGHSHSHAFPLLWGIALHHIPVAFALVSMLIKSNVSKITTIIMLVLFAAMSPFGMLTGISLGDYFLGDKAGYQIIMALVIGIFLHISTTILFETGDEHHFNLKKLISIVLGAAVAYFIIVA